MQTVTLSLFRFDGIGRRMWVLGQMGAARFVLPRVPGIGFWKLCGSGTGEGFTPRPNTAVWAILATWPDLATARDRVAQARPFATWAARAAETWTVFLEPASARGQWSGQQPFHPGGDTPAGPLAALTRASIRPARAMEFWRNAPAAQAAMQHARGCTLAMGLGEAPLMRQCTFSLWKDTPSMLDYAHKGAHQQAIEAAYRHQYFSESLFVRMRLLEHQGRWPSPHRAPEVRVEGGNVYHLPGPPP